MSIQDAIIRTLPHLRDEARSLMLDAGKALRPTGGMVYNPATQTEDDEYDDLFGPVRCKIKPPRTVAREAEAGGRTVVTVPAELHLPAEPVYAVLRAGDVWEMTGVGPLSLSRVGRRYRITSEADGSLVTACRYTVDRVVS